MPATGARHLPGQVARRPPSAGQPPAPSPGAQSKPAAPQGSAQQPGTAPLTSRAARFDLAEWWWVPAPGDVPASLSTAAKGLAAAVDLYETGKTAEALERLTAPALAATPLAGYALYYTGLAQQDLGQTIEARRTFDRLRALQPQGALAGLAITRAAAASAAVADHAVAATLYEEALSARAGDAPDLLLGLARSAAASGDQTRALESYARLYSEFPATEQAAAAETELSQLAEWPAVSAGSWRIRVERVRADRLFAAGRYKDARAAFDLVQPHVQGDEQDLARLRLAECDYHLGRYRAARDAVMPLTERGAHVAEALYYLASARRELNERERYLDTTRRLVDQHTATAWAENALNALATFHVIADEDDQAAVVFREMYSRWPRGRHAPRAAWRAGWWSYRHGRWNETIQVFESAAVAFTRSDYRPSWLYWAARARQRAGDRDGAAAGFRAVVSDYRNTFYGRRAMALMPPSAGPDPAPSPTGPSAGSQVPEAGPASAPAPAPPAAADSPAASQGPRGERQGPAGVPVTLGLIRLLISAELFDLAQQELAAARAAWGESPALLATEAWVAQAQGDGRRGIILMKRAYPHYLSTAPGAFPRPILEVLHPLDHWPLITKYANAHALDRWLVAALINQESTFDADVRSRAGAIGLMQIMPATGRRYARRLGIRRFTAAALTRPETNVRIGTALLADLLKQFKATHLALAAYNAGESRAVAWIGERRGLPDDEFIDDLPFPETQGYVRKVLSLAADYREIYDGKPITSKSQMSPSLLSGRR